jgi:hypothetical protein
MFVYLVVIAIHTIYLVYLKYINGTYMQIRRKVHLSRKTYCQLMLDERSHHETTVIQEEAASIYISHEAR